MLRVVETANEAARAAEALLTAYRIPRVWPTQFDRLRIPNDVAAADIDGRQDLRDVALVTIDGAGRPRLRRRRLCRAASPRRLATAGGHRRRFALRRSRFTLGSRRSRTRQFRLFAGSRRAHVAGGAVERHLLAGRRRRPTRDRVRDADFATRSPIRLPIPQRRHSLSPAPDLRRRPRLPGQWRSGAGRRRGRLAAHLARCLSCVAKAARWPWPVSISTPAKPASSCAADSPPASNPCAATTPHRLIEEAMIAANVAAARFLESKRRQEAYRPPPVYRVHEPPATDKLEALAFALRAAGEYLPSGPVTPQTLATICQRAKEKSRWPAWIWDAIVLRTLPQARYQLRRLGHFGLALPTYVHFTSPIRRYADLLIHRQIKGIGPPTDELDAAAAHVSMTERQAEEVERGVDAWLKCAFLEQHVGKTLRRHGGGGDRVRAIR